MTSVQFNGHYVMIYPDHLDSSTGKTLVAIPGQSYTVTAAPGRNAGLPNLPGDGRWGVSGYAIERPRETWLEEPADTPPAAPELPPHLQDAGGPETTPAAPEGATAPQESEE